MSQDISQLRHEIDRIDKSIVKMLLERGDVAKQIGEWKRNHKEPIYKPDRERQVYERIIQAAHEISGEELVLPERMLKNIYKEIMAAFISIQGGPSVAFLGPLGSFSHLAVKQRFGDFARFLPVDSIPEVFRCVEGSSEIDFGIVPADNTTEGSVGITLDQLLQSGLKIYAESYVKINHHLLAATTTSPKEIRKLYTLRIAREQCREWINRNLSLANLEIIETSSTSEAAKMASERKDGAAIASELSMELYGLSLVAANIQDNSNNITRFFLLSDQQCAPTGEDRTSIVFSAHDRPGSLYEVLEPFHRAGLNLTRIESKATRKNYGDYNFFIDLLGHQHDPEIQQILVEVEKRTPFLKILGSYPRVSHESI